MKKTNVLIMLTASLFLAAANCFGLHLTDPNGVLLTVEPNAYPTVWDNGFDLDGQITAWIDNRTYETNMQVYMTYLNDPCKTEYLIDANAVGVEIARVSGNNIFYTRIDPNTKNIIIREANCTDPNNPVIKDINTPAYSMGSFPSYIVSLDISGNLLVYVIREYYGFAQIYAMDITEPNRPSYLVEDYNTYNAYLQSNAAIDGTTCVWSSEAYDDVNGTRYYLNVADIADLNNPSVQKTVMPQAVGKGSMSLSNLDISGDWLVALGYWGGANEIFGIHNFQNTDVNQWDITELWKGGYEDSLGNPVIDGSFAVWPINIFGGGSPMSYSGIGLDNPAALIAGATLLDNGAATTDVLKTTNDPNVDFSAVHISGSEIVWSYYYNDYSTSTQYADLYNGTLAGDCSDWGYSFADLNHDCLVNFKDFAVFAARWLNCTTPDQSGCIYGDVYQRPDGSWLPFEE